MFERLRSKFDTFQYNFRWDDYVSYLNGTTAKAARFVPLIGYAIIFNDYVAENLTFSELAGEDLRTTFFLQPDARLRFIFFGVFILAFANAAYLLARPYALKIAETERGYTDYFLNYGTAETFLRLHLEIQRETHFTLDGKYYTDDWDLFWREATWVLSGKGNLKKEDFSTPPPGYQSVHFSDAKLRHQSLLLSILRETYFREATSRRLRLCVVLLLATVGYALLAIPSLDLFLRVLEIVFLIA